MLCLLGDDFFIEVVCKDEVDVVECCSGVFRGYSIEYIGIWKV